ncbi:thermolysin metallopeptidase [Aspergillus costaricaensis CBS 115574]|uniref:Thermolysin metallopeptidase n=1 Tax=Aspergillus costaricaensis CBS 115574 TaxID=1448317 RepID=A0ACD1IGC7_9EURO|nr:thermolysin metallopeptidase [Aspergillus costaricaensis CBS 115574]RAK89282.1 thermolysin metallopeptidase [Aspergillus costaricaensis CBS 115574]
MSTRDHHTCTFIQPQILHHISTSPIAPSKARRAAFRTLTLANEIHHIRLSSSPNISLTPHAQARDIYDCRNKRGLPGLLIRTESSSGPTTQDDTVNHVYNSFGIFLHFLSSVLGRRSTDNDGLRLIGCLHYDKNLNNAFWNGQEIIFGDGDGVYFTGFPKSLDVVVHELMHGVTDHTAGLLYEGQSGALSESISDVFACVVEQWWRRQGVEEADWVVGRGVCVWPKGKKGAGAGVGEMGLRSLKAPGTAYDDAVLGRDGQPSHMRGFVCTEKDNGGVHWNSGIPSHAFYLCAVGFGGRSWERAAVVWYQALTDPRVEPNCSFERFACVTVDIAEAMFGEEAGGLVRNAWVEVGVEVGEVLWTVKD